jgi:hypothetical protein
MTTNELIAELMAKRDALDAAIRVLQEERASDGGRAYRDHSGVTLPWVWHVPLVPTTSTFCRIWPTITATTGGA